MKLVQAPGVLLTIGFLFASAPARAQEGAEFKSVYILPMSNGLDQFLAIRLTDAKVMQVVTDPRKADAVFTDRIGAAFEQRLDELYGERPKAEEKDKDSLTGSTTRPVTSLSHGKGTMFLVDRRTRAVIWSTYVKPKSTNSDEMNHVAEQIVSRFEKDHKTK